MFDFGIEACQAIGVYEGGKVWRLRLRGVLISRDMLVLDV